MHSTLNVRSRRTRSQQDANADISKIEGDVGATTLAPDRAETITLGRAKARPLSKIFSAAGQAAKSVINLKSPKKQDLGAVEGPTSEPVVASSVTAIVIEDLISEATMPVGTIVESGSVKERKDSDKTIVDSSDDAVGAEPDDNADSIEANQSTEDAWPEFDPSDSQWLTDPEPITPEIIDPLFKIENGRDVLVLLIRVILFIPWCITIGGAILTWPSALDVLAFRTGYFPAGPPTGVKRFAHWLECAKQHVGIFGVSLVLLVWWDVRVGLAVVGCVCGGMWGAWRGFEVDTEIQLGKGDDERQILYLVYSLR